MCLGFPVQLNALLGPGSKSQVKLRALLPGERLMLLRILDAPNDRYGDGHRDAAVGALQEQTNAARAKR